MAQPTPNDGTIQLGVVKAGHAMDLLEQALAGLKPQDPRRDAIARALKELALSFPKDENTKAMTQADILSIARHYRDQSPVIAAMRMSGDGEEQGEGSTEY